LGSISTNKLYWLEKFLKEQLQWTMRGSTRLNVALEGNFKIYEKTHGKKLEDVDSMWSIYRLSQISIQLVKIKTKRTIALMLSKWIRNLFSLFCKKMTFCALAELSCYN
jgi:hypothetical protein